MGVDARILLKITDPQHWLSPEQLRQHSARLSTVIGHDKFFLFPEHNQHAIIYVEDEYREHCANQDEPHYDPDGPVVYFQDGEDIVAKPNEQLLEVRIWTRYYAPEYARGDWRTLYFVMLWCHKNIPSCEVWYGGDSGGAEAELMTRERLEEMSDYYLTEGHDAYFKFAKNKYQCEFCGIGVEESGGGGDHKFFRCEGCGKHWLVKSSGFFGPKFVCAWGDLPTDNKYHPNVFDMSHQVSDGTRPLHPFGGVFKQTYN